MTFRLNRKWCQQQTSAKLLELLYIKYIISTKPRSMWFIFDFDEAFKDRTHKWPMTEN